MFGAHCLGGLVAKDMLWHSYAEEVQHSFSRYRLAVVKPATIGITFDETPHQGLKQSQIGTHVYEFDKGHTQEPA